MFLLLIAGVVGWSVYSYWSEYSEAAAKRARESMSPSAGANCTVSLLDSKALSGKFVKLNDEWIVLQPNEENSKQEIWIPRESVSHMRVE